ncbi:hypothetical protein D3C75_485380 [compost metagenome]
MYGAHPGAGGGADQHAVPLQAGIAARGAEAGQQAAVHRPGQLAAGLGEGAVDRRGVAGNQWAAAGRAAPAAVGGGGQAALGLLAGALLGQLARLLGFAGLAGEGFLDGLEYLGQLGLLALAGLELAIAVAQFAVELGQRAAALVADLVQRAAAVLQFELLAGQQGVLGGQVGLDAVQLAQGVVVAGQLLAARAAEVVVVGQVAGELLGPLLIEQQLEVFLTAALVGGADLDGDQLLLLSALALEFFFLLVEALDLALAVLELLLESIDLLLQGAHLALGALQLLLDAGLLLLQAAEQFLQLGDVALRGFQLALGIGALIGDGRGEAAGEQGKQGGAQHGQGSVW